MGLRADDIVAYIHVHGCPQWRCGLLGSGPVTYWSLAGSRAGNGVGQISCNHDSYIARDDITQNLPTNPLRSVYFRPNFGLPSIQGKDNGGMPVTVVYSASGGGERSREVLSRQIYLQVTRNIDLSTVYHRQKPEYSRLGKKMECVWFAFQSRADVM